MYQQKHNEYQLSLSQFYVKTFSKYIAVKLQRLTYIFLHREKVFSFAPLERKKQREKL